MLSGKPLGFVALLGVLALIGIITKNAVILVGQIEAERAAGKSVWNAALDASATRFRPIMLTAVSTVLGMIPIAPTVFWGPMAYAIMGGLLVGTVLTLVFLPTLYVTCVRPGPGLTKPKPGETARQDGHARPRGRSSGGHPGMTDLSRHPVFAFVPSLPGRKRAGRALAALAALAFVAGCGRGTDTPPTAGRPVRVVTVESTKLRNALTLTGEIQAQADVNIAFRIGGRRMVASTLKVGRRRQGRSGDCDVWTRRRSRMPLRAAECGSRSRRAAKSLTRATHSIARSGCWTRGSRRVLALRPGEAGARTAQARLEDAEARAETSQNRLGFTSSGQTRPASSRRVARSRAKSCSPDR